MGAPPPLEVLGREVEIVYEDDWQPEFFELALERAPLGDDDRAEEEALPGAVAVEPRADGGQDLQRRGEDKPR